MSQVLEVELSIGLQAFSWIKQVRQLLLNVRYCLVFNWLINYQTKFLLILLSNLILEVNLLMTCCKKKGERKRNYLHFFNCYCVKFSATYTRFRQLSRLAYRCIKSNVVTRFCKHEQTTWRSRASSHSLSLSLSLHSFENLHINIMDDSSDDDTQGYSNFETLHVQTPLIHSPKLSIKLDW